MREGSPNTIYLKDYTPPAFLIDTVDLHFDLGEDATTVRSKLSLRRNPGAASAKDPLVLNGEQLELLAVTLDGRALSAQDYVLDNESLTLTDVPAKFELLIETRIKPQHNTSLEGLYQSSGNYCTQCEAQGFRRITYFLDRPDVMSSYTTSIEADSASCPVLLSNGNLVDSGELEGERHFAKWQDPYPKPCYLFALVAGNLLSLEDSYTTASGRQVALRIYVQAHNIDKCDHAMASLKKAMQWDEEVFGLEYDLDIYMIVAVDDFNMGAMENKGLNVFNSKYVLARPDTATDDDYVNIEAVIGHEYFHNWTGNRITCRDWFQLSLKEGLTVFRDQEFTADMTSRAVKRINDVRALRARQFSEDAGPMAHPVRPQSYMQIDNFYTLTVYEKGAEVVRMYHTLLGAEGFRKGMDLYFQRHDGQAVTTDDFAAAMADSNDRDLTQFKRWYDQAGTPQVDVSGEWDDRAKTYRLEIRQSCPDTPGQAGKQPFAIPLSVGLLNSEGNDMPLQLAGEAGGSAYTRVFEVTEAAQSFIFADVPVMPVPSLLRGFSAPVKLCFDYSNEELAFLLANDSDAFNRWDAGQRLALNILLTQIEAYQAGRDVLIDPLYCDALRDTLKDTRLDAVLVAATLALPGENIIAEYLDVVDVDAVHHVYKAMQRAIASGLEPEFSSAYHANEVSGTYRYVAADMGKRSLRNTCLGYLLQLDKSDYISLAQQQFEAANNMTDSIGALRALIDVDVAQREQALMQFEAQWRHDTLVMDKWFSLQAMADQPDALDTVKGLMRHELFSIKNPNKVRSLINMFAINNPVHFHQQSGEAYRFVADRVLEIDPLNPHVAAALAGAFLRWKKYDVDRQALMRAEQQRILQTEGLSKNVYEIISKSVK